MDAQTLAAKLLETWPARLAQDAWSAAKAPGNALASTPENPVTIEQMIKPAADLAGLLTAGAGGIPGGANELRAGVRPYQNVPDNLMGYRRNGPQKGYGEQNYSHSQPVQVTFPGGETFIDAVTGMNADHALERAYRNWPGAINITAVPAKP